MWKKPEPSKRRNHDLSDIGWTEIPDDFDPSDEGHGDENDNDLEAELSATVDGGVKQELKEKPKSKLIPSADLDKMISESMRDIGSDEELSDDEDDSELLGELQRIAGGEIVEEPAEAQETTEQQVFLPTTTIDTISIIKSRIEMYKLAKSAAKEAGESAKARRFNRGLKTLNDLLKQSVEGNRINVDDIPPEVSVKSAKTANEPAADSEEPPKVPSRTAPAVPSRAAPEPPPQVEQTPPAEEKNEETTVVNRVVAELNERKQEYEAATLSAERSDDTAMALQFAIVLKQFDVVTKMCEEGKEVDLSDMPPHPSQFSEFLAKMQAAAAAEPPKIAEPVPKPAPPKPEDFLN